MVKLGHATPPGPLLCKQQPTRPYIPVAEMEAKSHHQPKQGGTCKNYTTSKDEYTNT
jgi:hypothetical protein